jgi:hypothetical protein
MKWIGKRINFVEDKNRTTIVIFPEKKALITGLMGAWLSMWMVIGATSVWALSVLKLSEKEQIVLWVFLAFWLYYAIKVTRTFLWILWGKELIKIDEVALNYKRSIRTYGRSVPYYFENIKKMAVQNPKEGSFQSVWESSPWIAGGERLEFEYQGKIVRFGRKLEERDAKLLFDLVTKKIEERLRAARSKS